MQTALRVADGKAQSNPFADIGSRSTWTRNVLAEIAEDLAHMEQAFCAIQGIEHPCVPPVESHLRIARPGDEEDRLWCDKEAIEENGVAAATLDGTDTSLQGATETVVQMTKETLPGAPQDDGELEGRPRTDRAMEYFRQIGLHREPFSTSPDPVFFYASPSYAYGLQRLETEVRLRRGLHVVLGEVGVGKTTMARVLLRRLEQRHGEFVCRLLSDPTYANEHELLTELAWLFGVKTEVDSVLALRNGLRNFLFEKALEEGKTVVLIVDEGQALSAASVEALRHLLNFETNDQKLLQLVIFGQPEFQRQLQQQYNFADRVNFGFVMRPFDEQATRDMIAFRLNRAGLNGGGQRLFTDDAIRAIYAYTQGVSRRITMLCHDGLMAMLMRGQERIDRDLISSVAMRRTCFFGRR